MRSRHPLMLCVVVAMFLAAACDRSSSEPTSTLVTGASTATPSATFASPSTTAGSAGTASVTAAPVATLPLPTATAPPIATATATPAPTSTATPGPSSRSVTLADNGSTIRMRPGDRVLLNLGDTYQWSPTVDDQSALRRVVNITVIRGAQGVYEAVGVGPTDLSATGDLPCHSATPPCLAPSLLFRMHVIVE